MTFPSLRTLARGIEFDFEKLIPGDVYPWKGGMGAPSLEGIWTENVHQSLGHWMGQGRYSPDGE